jgi:hypothetical protein
MAFETDGVDAIDVDDLVALDDKPMAKQNADFAAIMQQ